MTMIDSSFETNVLRDGETPRFFSTFSKLAAMSLPIMLGAAAMALLHMGQAGILGNIDNQQPLYQLSMLQPWYLLFFAFLEALAITGQVFSAKSKNMWPKGGVKIAVIFLSILSIGILFVLLQALQFGQGLLVDQFALVDAATIAVLPQYLLTLSPFFVFEILNGALRGQGRTLPGFVILAVTVVLNLGATWYFLNMQGLGIEALFLANVISGSFATVSMAAAFVFIMRGGTGAPVIPSLMRSGTLLAVVGVPVFFSMVVSFFSSAVLFDRMAEFGTEQVSGFLLAVRLRFFLLIPAIALGTSLAVLVNQAETELSVKRTTLLTQGAVSVFVIYAGLIAMLYAVYPTLVAFMAEAPEVRLAANDILRLLLPSFVLVGIVVFAHLILENLGRGARVFVWTALLEAATIYVLLTHGTNVTAALYVLIGSALVYGLIFSMEYGLLVRKQGHTPARVADQERGDERGVPA